MTVKVKTQAIGGEERITEVIYLVLSVFCMLTSLKFVRAMDIKQRGFSYETL